MRERGTKRLTLYDRIHNDSFKANIVHCITFKITLKKELTEMNDRTGGGHKMTINFPFISWRINSQTIQSIFGIQEIQPLFKFVHLICKMGWILKRNQIGAIIILIILPQDYSLTREYEKLNSHFMALTLKYIYMLKLAFKGVENFHNW